MGTKNLIFYTKEHCPLCDKAHNLLKDLQKEITFNIKTVDIYKDDTLLEKYGLMIPVIEVDGTEIDYGIISIDKVKKALTNF
ncbi:glutaredoxin family protein [Fictibacillus phosphorivorans]|uniref:glutaredoxin family protein n=1 Tax=Fictibacillus phosphorivorans TaxID=1221500 RepID=UPI0020411317|nr:glutaredoxin family protein [Fictibacillus phosphorivorans]MCM3718251.1 glutaredoxin family protein [Fictibacillus phosphorivorans]MCM3775882.1 glutaredoxin family protein [Fictibacillus phosphorivorans]